MGGRRSYSINTIIRKSPDTPSKKANLTKALKNEDVEAITKSSAALFSKHRDLAKIFLLSDRLLKLILKKHSRIELEKSSQIASIVRKDWSKFKVEEGISDDKVIDDSVVNSVSKYLKQRTK